MSDVMKPFRDLVDNRHEWIENYKKETGKKIIGYFCDNTPEEVVHAAGMIPIRITGETGNVVETEKFLAPNVCSYTKRCFELAIKGVYDYLDGLVVTHSCDAITKLYELWAYRLETPEFLHFVWMPHKVFDPPAQTVYEGEVKRMKKCFEKLIEKEISDDDLVDAIDLCNTSRRLLKRVTELRKTDPPKATGEEVFYITLASMLAPKDMHNQWTESFLEERENGKGPKLESRPRITISVSILDEPSLLKAIEDAGMWVVADDSCTGSRYFWDEVPDPDGKPVKAIAYRYLNKIPCPRSYDSQKPRIEHILNLTKDYNAEGVIFYILRCCDAFLYQYPGFKDKVADSGAKVLYIQGDQTVGINENQKSRISAFGEMLQGE